jgi:hypothetical protein
MIEPPKFYTEARRHYDMMDIEILGKFIVELGLHCRPDVRAAFERLMIAAGTQHFPRHYGTLYDYIMKKRDEIKLVYLQRVVETDAEHQNRDIEFCLPLIDDHGLRPAIVVAPTWIDESARTFSAYQHGLHIQSQQPNGANVTALGNTKTKSQQRHSFQSAGMPYAGIRSSSQLSHGEAKHGSRRRFSSPAGQPRSSLQRTPSFGPMRSWYLRQMGRASFSQESLASNCSNDSLDQNVKRSLEALQQEGQEAMSSSSTAHRFESTIQENEQLLDSKAKINAKEQQTSLGEQNLMKMRHWTAYAAQANALKPSDSVSSLASTQSPHETQDPFEAWISM